LEGREWGWKKRGDRFISRQNRGRKKEKKVSYEEYTLVGEDSQRETRRVFGEKAGLTGIETAHANQRKYMKRILRGGGRLGGRKTSLRVSGKKQSTALDTRKKIKDSGEANRGGMGTRQKDAGNATEACCGETSI